jgi:hypothetical protein
MGWDGLARIDVVKSAYHQQSQIEITSDNPVLDSYLEVFFASSVTGWFQVTAGRH